MLRHYIIILGNPFRILLATIVLLAASSALAQFRPDDVEIEPLCDNRLSVSWRPLSGASRYQIVEEGGQVFCHSSDSSCETKELKEGQSYYVFVDANVNGDTIFGSRRIHLKAFASEKCPSRRPPKIATPRPRVDTCANLPADVVVTGYSPYMTQCNRVGAAGVGDPDLIAQGVVDAVDIWHTVESSILTCFRNRGTLKFVDTATMPRTVSDLALQSVNGLTCGTIDRVGTVVLMQTAETSVTTVETVETVEVVETVETVEAPQQTEPEGDTETTQTQTEMEFPHARAVINCPLTTGNNLNLRQGPGLNYDVISEIPYGTRLSATERAEDWYKVAYAGAEGWIYSKLVRRHGSCARP